MKKFLIVGSVLIGAAFQDAFAQKPAIVASNEPGWTHVGHTTASFKMQSESISIHGADEFTAIKIKVSEAPLHIERLQVFYESGDMEEIDVRDHFAKGKESRVINLKHPDKDIQKVAFTYKTEANAQGEKADIDLWGLKTNQPAGSDSYKDEKKELKEESREAKNELREESREAREEVREESRELREEAREGRNELREEAREEDREIDEDIELEDENDRDIVDAVEEGAKDAAAAIGDKKIKNKVGPGGETAYVDDDGRYYIINNLGEKEFITKMQLKKKVDDDK